MLLQPIFGEIPIASKSESACISYLLDKWADRGGKSCGFELGMGQEANQQGSKGIQARGTGCKGSGCLEASWATNIGEEMQERLVMSWWLAD